MKDLIEQLGDYSDLRDAHWELGAVLAQHLPHLRNWQLLDMIVTWHLLFSQAIDTYLRAGGHLAGKRVLCGFNVVNDEIYYLASAEDLQKLAAVWGVSRRSKRAPGSPTSFGEVLGCIAEMAAHPQREGKYKVDDYELLHALREGAWKAGLAHISLLGGAAGNMAYLLGHLGVETLIHCPYHTEGASWSELDDSVKYLAVAPSGNTLRSARRPITDLPYKTTVGFQLCPSWQHGRLQINVRDSARALFMGREVRLPQGDHDWTRVTIESPGQKRNWPWGSSGDDWPHPQLFSGIGSIHSELVIYAPDTGEIMAREADHPIEVAVLGGLGIPQSPAMLDNIRRDQLTGLRKSDVAIHTEMNDKFDIRYLANLVKATQSAKTSVSTSSGWSVALNADDALKLSKRARWEQSIRQSAGNEYVLRFERGVRLLMELGVDWVYVHGTEIDMAVWRSDLGGALGKKLRDAMLFAKAAVIAGMIRRIVPPYLWPMMSHLLEDTSLAAKGFEALAQFAQDLDASLPSRKWENVPTGIGSALLTDGYVDCGRPSRWNCDVGLSVAPVYWPTDVAPYLSATGAGDFTSAVVAAYVW